MKPIHLFRLVAVWVLAACCLQCGTSYSTNDASTDAAVTSSAGRFVIRLDNPSGFARGTNTFRVQVTDTGGTPGRLDSVLAVMPAHGHTAVPTAITAGSDGWFTVTDLGIEMSGQWRIDFTVSRAGDGEDTASVWADVP